MDSGGMRTGKIDTGRIDNGRMEKGGMDEKPHAREETPHRAPMGISERDEAVLRSAARDDLVLLARLHGGELDGETLDALMETPFAALFSLVPDDETARQAASVIDNGWRAMDSGDTGGRSRLLDELAADFAALYLTGRHRAWPDESPWLDDDDLSRQQPMLEVRRWYERFGLAARDWRKLPDDHIALQLAFIAHLMDGDAALEEAARFMDAHLMRWLADFAAAAAARCDTPFYAGLAMFTHAWCAALRGMLTRVTGVTPPPPEETADGEEPPAHAVGQPFVPGTGPVV